jgi:hypothetical protein
LLVYVFRGKASRTSVLAYSVGQQIALAAFNVAAALVALFYMVGTTDFRSVIRLGREEEKRATAERTGESDAEGPTEALRSEP